MLIRIILSPRRGFNLQALQAWLSARPSAYRCNPRLFDTDCLHTPYLPHASFLTQSMQTTASVPKPRRKSTGNVNMNSKDRDVPEADLLGLGHDGPYLARCLSMSFADARIIEENTMHCGSHAEGIDESEALLTHKREHQIHDRERLNRSNDDAAAESAAARKAEAQRRVTGFKTRPSALAGDAPPKRKHSKGSIHDSNNNGSDWEGDEDDGDEEWVPDLFVFEYGTVVIWGMTEKEEKRVLASL